MLLSNSSGFDLYAHSSMYYYFDTVTYTNYNFFDFLIFPRYLFLSYLYEFMGRIGIPLGYFVIFMLLFPIYFIINYCQEFKCFQCKHGFYLNIDNGKCVKKCEDSNIETKIKSDKKSISKNKTDKKHIIVFFLN